MTFLLGRQAMLGQEPPRYLRLDRGDALSLLRKCPGKELRSGAAAKDDEVVVFNFKAVHVNSPNDE
jgi:hypothetical protein